MDTVLTLFDALRRASEIFPTNSIIFKDRGFEQEPDVLLYSELFRVVTRNAAKLKKSGIVTPDKVVVLYFNNHRDNVIWYWSVIAAGGIPAILNALSNNPTTMAGELDNLSKLFSGDIILTSKQLTKFFHLIPTITTWTIQQVQIQPEVEGKFEYPRMHYGSLATLLFTSGSTGHSKAVEFTHYQLISSAKAKIKHHSTHSTDTFMSWIGFDHSVSLCEMHLQAILVGANQVMVQTMDFVQEPTRFWKAISEYRISYAFSPNFFLATATKSLKEQKVSVDYDFSHLKVLMCGGEASKTATLGASDEVLRRFGAPEHTIKCAYGLSETCSAIFYNRQIPSYDIANDNIFTTVGNSIPGIVEIRIVDENGYRVPPQSPGAIHLRGIAVFRRYYNNHSATASCMTKDGWFDTGDLGYLDHNENLCIVGRSKEIMIINGQNYSSFELEYAIESTVSEALTPSFTACFSVWTVNEANSESVIVIFNPPDDNTDDTPALRNTISLIKETTTRFCSKTPFAVIPLPRVKLPKSTLGKLSRAKLKDSYQSGAFDRFILPEIQIGTCIAPSAQIETPLQKIIQTVLVQETGLRSDQVHLDLVLSDLNIDSLTYMRIKTGLERGLDCEDPLSMPQILGCRTVRDIDIMLLSIGTTTPEYDPIVPLVHRGDRAPIILCHPGGGEFLTWLSILPYLPNRKILALRVRGFHKNEDLFKSVDEMLDKYITAIKQHLPKGPYILLGLCFGGMLSFELAKRLESNGDEVAFIGGIDNPPDLREVQVREDTRNFIIDLLHFFQLLSEDEAHRWEKEMEGLPDDQFVDGIFARFPDGTLEKLDLTHAKLEAWSRINENMQEISRNYVPTGKVSKYDLFWVPPIAQLNHTEYEWRHSSRLLGKWKDHVHNATDEDVLSDGGSGPLRYHRVQGQHLTILRPENIDVFQKLLNSALEARGV